MQIVIIIVVVSNFFFKYILIYVQVTYFSRTFTCISDVHYIRTVFMLTEMNGFNVYLNLDIVNEDT